MKKVCSIASVLLCVVCLFLAFAGCEASKTQEEAFAEKWGFGGFLYDNDVIADEETAISVATALFENIRRDGSAYDDCAFTSVRYHESNAAWIVTFARKSEDGAVILGRDCTIILRKSDGCVLGIVFGE